MDNFTNLNQDPREALAQLRKMNKTNTFLRMGIVFLLGIVPLIFMLSMTFFAPDITDIGIGRVKDSGAFNVITVDQAWMISGLTLLGVTAISIFLSVVVAEVKYDVIAPTMGLSFASMIFFSVPSLPLWAAVLIWFVLAFFMTSIFFIFVIMTVVYLNYKKIKKQLAAMGMGGPNGANMQGMNPEEMMRNMQNMFGGGNGPTKNPFIKPNVVDKKEDSKDKDNITIDVESKEEDEDKDKK